MSDARLAVSLALASLLARVVLDAGTAMFGADGAEYLLMADWMREGRFHDALSVQYHPLYPLLTAAFRGLTGDTERSGLWVSMLLGSAATAPLFLAARSAFGRPAAVIAALFYALQPQIVEVQADAMTEGTFCFFFFSSIWLIRRSMEEPSLERSIVAGLAASASYLTRPEGILAVVLAVAWPLVEAFRRREGRARRIAFVAVGAVAMILLAFPYLLWIRSEMGAWKLSPKPSVQAAERGLAATGEGESSSRGAQFLGSVWKATFYGLAVPFLLAGLAELRRHRLRDLLYYLSFPAGYFAGLLWSLRAIPGYSYRYVLPPMALLMALAGSGWDFLARRVPARWAPAIAAGLLLPMAAFALRPHRTEEAALREAAAWIRARGIPAGSVYSNTDKLGYFLHGMVRPMRAPSLPLRDLVARHPAEVFAILQRGASAAADSTIEWLRETGRIAGEPLVFTSPKGRGRVLLYLAGRSCDGPFAAGAGARGGRF